MKKISLLEKFRFTDRFLQGGISKVIDAVIVPDGKESVKRDGQYWVFNDGERVHCRFKEGESLPVVMSYRAAGLDSKVFGSCMGWNDKRFVNERYMPHRLVVEHVRCVRVQDLTEEDALGCGVWKNRGGYYMVGGACGGVEEDWRKMFSIWFNLAFRVPYAFNPWVVIYDMTPVIANASAGTEFAGGAGIDEKPIKWNSQERKKSEE